MPEAMKGRPNTLVEDKEVIEIDEESRAMNQCLSWMCGEEMKMGGWREDDRAAGKEGPLGIMPSWCGMQVTGVSLIQIEGRRMVGFHSTDLTTPYWSRALEV